MIWRFPKMRDPQSSPWVSILKWSNLDDLEVPPWFWKPPFGSQTLAFFPQNDPFKNPMNIKTCVNLYNMDRTCLHDILRLGLNGSNINGLSPQVHGDTSLQNSSPSQLHSDSDSDVLIFCCDTVSPLVCCLKRYTLWWTYKKQWKMAIEIVDFPIENGDFPWQNVSSPEGIIHVWLLFTLFGCLCQFSVVTFLMFSCVLLLHPLIELYGAITHFWSTDFWSNHVS